MEIPFEKQLGSSVDRMCGAAALCMVYGSFEIEKDQKTVWESIKNKSGYADTKDFAKDLLNNKLKATIMRIKANNKDFLMKCSSKGIRCILLHSLNKQNKNVGHFIFTLFLD